MIYSILSVCYCLILQTDDDFSVLSRFFKTDPLIVDYDRVKEFPKTNILGVRHVNPSDAEWKTNILALPNLQFLSLIFNGEDFENDIVPVLRQCKGLRFLSLRSPQLARISDSIGTLTNLPLEYLMLNFPDAGAISGKLYNISTLRELFVASPAPLPDGISQLTNLLSLTLFAKNGTFKVLPKDLTRLKIRNLFIGQGKGVSKVAMELPETLEILEVVGTDLVSVPKAWLSHQTLRVLHLTDNKIEVFPHDLTGLPNLQALHLDSNKIQRIPKISSGESLGEISISDNPLDKVSDENKELFKRVRLVK